MDSLDAFRPLFAYVAHWAAALDAADGDAASASMEAARRDLRMLVAEAGRRRAGEIDPNFDQAWFAVAVWIEGVVLRVSGGEEIVAESGLFPSGNLSSGSSRRDREEDFFRRAELLLTPFAGAKGYPREIAGILSVYRFCLELGGLAFHEPDSVDRMGKYRDRCRAVTAMQVQTAGRQPVPARSGRAGRGGVASAAAVWIGAVVVPLGLYGVCRFLLRDLYAVVLG